jgi:hypothetical protein
MEERGLTVSASGRKYQAHVPFRNIFFKLQFVRSYKIDFNLTSIVIIEFAIFGPRILKLYYKLLSKRYLINQQKTH